jgi:hypothetical protein
VITGLNIVLDRGVNCGEDVYVCISQRFKFANLKIFPFVARLT